MQLQSPEIQKVIDEIIQGIDFGETIIFCGAGISRDSGLPTVNQIVPYIFEKFDLPENDLRFILDNEGYPKIPFESFIEALKENSEIDEILDIFNQGEPNINHHFLANLIKTGKVKTIVTTNFDRLIERALAMNPIALEKDKDYDVIYHETDFKYIKWFDDRIRIIKIHGSIDDKEAMAITLKQVSSHYFSQSRGSIIEQVFSSGKHSNVLILGYSSSDIFDISLQIEVLNEKYKKIFYIQHSFNQKVEKISEQPEKNPFKRFNESQRLYCSTGELIKILWISLINQPIPIEENPFEIKWKENIDKWHNRIIKEHSIANYYIILAHLFLNKGESHTALKYYRKALAIIEIRNDKVNLGRCFGGLGNTFWSLGEYKKAIEYYEHALEIAIEIGDLKNEGLWAGNLGNTYYRVGEYENAIYFNEQAIKIAKEIGDRQNEGLWLGNLGNAFWSLGDYNKAIEYTEQALMICNEISDKHGEGVWLGNLGNTYNRLGDYCKAIEYYEQALRIAIVINDRHGEASRLGNIGFAYLSLMDFTKAIEYYEKALGILYPMFGSNHPQSKMFENNLRLAKSKVEK